MVINRGQYDKTIPMNHVQMANLAVPLPLSSSCSSNSDSTSLDKFSFAKKQVEEAKLVVNLDSNQKLVFNVKNLKTGSEKVDSESKQNMTV